MYQKEIAKLIIHYIKDVAGKGPSLIKITISENIINVDAKGVLTILEQNLLKKNHNNKALIKLIRKQLAELVLHKITEDLRKVTQIKDLKITSYTSLMDYENDRQIIVFICNKFIQ